MGHLQKASAASMGPNLWFDGDFGDKRDCYQPGTLTKSSQMELPRVWLEPSICQDEVAAPNRNPAGTLGETSLAKAVYLVIAQA